MKMRFNLVYVILKKIKGWIRYKKESIGILILIYKVVKNT